jgi:hypothetical protein
MQALTIIGILFGIAASSATIIVVLGPILRVVYRVAELCDRLIPKDGPCIVDRMETVETEIKLVKGDVKDVKGDVEKLKQESHEQIEALGHIQKETHVQTNTLGRIEQATSPPATTERDAEMVRKLGGDQTRENGD